MANLVVDNGNTNSVYNTMNDPCVADRFGAEYVVNDSFNVTSDESFTEVEPYHGYPNRLYVGEEIRDRIYDHDYNPETTLYHVNPDEITLVEGEVVKLNVYPGTGASDEPKSALTHDIPSLIWMVPDEYQDIVYIVDGNRIKALNIGIGKVRIYNTVDDKFFEVTVNVTSGPSGQTFIIEP